jgi:MFS family permease
LTSRYLKDILRNMSFTSAPALPRAVMAIALARAVSLAGDEVALLALVFRARTELGHWGVAAVLIAGTAPLVLMSPVAGLLVDRVRTRRLLFVVTTLQVALCSALTLAAASTLVVTLAALAAATAVATPAWQALLPAIVSDEQLPAATGWIQSASAVAGIAGPFLGGLLFAGVGYRGALAVDAASFVVLLGVPAFVRADRRPERAPAPGGHGDSMMSGFAAIAHDPVVRSLAVVLTLVVLTLGLVNIVEVFFTTSVLHAGPRAYGALGLTMGSGLLVASSATGRIAERFARTERVLLTACAALAVLLALFALSGHLWQAAIALFLVGVANAVVNSHASLLLARATKPVAHLRGRIFAAVTGLMSSAQIASIALGGVLLSLWSPRTIIVIAAAATTLVLVLTSRSLVRASVVAIPASDVSEPSERRAGLVSAPGPGRPRRIRPWVGRTCNGLRHPWWAR